MQQGQPNIFHRLMTRKEFFITIGGLIVAGLTFWLWSQHHGHGPQTPAATTTNTTSSHPGSDFNKKQYSLTDPTSIWVIANKPLPLKPVTYVPPDLTVPNMPLRVPGNETMQVRQATASALEALAAGAKTDGYDLMLASGYRSYQYQVNLYNGYVTSQGQASADQASARPGHSEHQTGLAADLEPASKSCELDACFGQLPEGKWLAANCYKYGFIIRYPADKVAVTGYEYEPWHVRYVGVALATEMHRTGVETLEEFFGQPGGNSYD